MSTSDLIALAERCEQATGPDNDLDVAISVAFGGMGGLPAKHRWNSTPHYTSSLDAALTLLPEGMMWVGGYSPSRHGAMAVCPDGKDHGAEARAATPALALCAAALRALAQNEQSND